MVANDDTVVDQSKILELANKRSTIAVVEDNHRLEQFEKWVILFLTNHIKG